MKNLPVLVFSIFAASSSLAAENLEGNWKTKCIKNANTYNIIFFGIEKKSIAIKQTFFHDSICSSPKSSGNIDVVGEYTAVETGDSTYDVDVSLDGKVVLYENFKIENDVLYMGDRKSGDASSPETRPTKHNMDWPFYKSPEITSQQPIYIIR